ncbi:MAG: inositol monophosphatase family protein [Bellilinea sp.]
MQPTLNQVIEWAHQAGAILRSGFRQDIQIHHKGPIDLVTEMDHRSEAYLLKEITSAFPDHAIFSEESGRLNGAHDQQWYVDPLDGTVNYAHGIPIFSVSIAYAVDGELQLGVVYDPIHDETYAAERGKGATLNGTPIHPTRVNQMIDGLLVTGFPYTMRSPDEPDNLALFTRFAKIAQGMRRLGSAALDLCYVAEGRLDGYWEIGLQPYDLAAGVLILREAGGTVTRITGETEVLTPPCDVVAANPLLHARMLDVIQEG